MTKLLQKAFDKASQLPNELQNQIAQDLIDEIEWELKWDATLSNSEDFLEDLARKALDEYKSGKCQKKGIDEL